MLIRMLILGSILSFADDVWLDEKSEPQADVTNVCRSLGFWSWAGEANGGRIDLWFWIQKDNDKYKIIDGHNVPCASTKVGTVNTYFDLKFNFKTLIHTADKKSHMETVDRIEKSVECDPIPHMLLKSKREYSGVATSEGWRPVDIPNETMLQDIKNSIQQGSTKSKMAWKIDPKDKFNAFSKDNLRLVIVRNLDPAVGYPLIGVALTDGQYKTLATYKRVPLQCD